MIFLSKQVIFTLSGSILDLLIFLLSSTMDFSRSQTPPKSQSQGERYLNQSCFEAVSIHFSRPIIFGICVESGGCNVISLIQTKVCVDFWFPCFGRGMFQRYLVLLFSTSEWWFFQWATARVKLPLLGLRKTQLPMYFRPFIKGPQTQVHL